MKKLLAVLILVLLLAGCHQTDPVNTTPPVTTEPIVTTAPTETATAPTEPVLTEAINAISLKAVGEQMEMVALDHRTAAVMEKTFDVANAKMNTVFRILDLYTGEVRLEQTVEGRWNLLPQGGLAGNIFLTEGSTHEILVLDGSLQEVKRFSGVGEDGMVSADLATFYYLMGDKLYAMSTDTGEKEQILMEPMVSVREIQGYDPQKNVLFLSIYTDPYGVERGVCALKLEDNSLVFLNGMGDDGGLAESGYCMVKEDTLDLMGDLSYCNLDGSVSWTVRDFVGNNNDYSTFHIAGTDYFYKISYNKDDRSKVDKVELYRLGRTLEVCRMEDPLDDKRLNRTQLLQDGNLLLVEVSRRSYKFYVVLPQLLVFTEAVAPEVLSVPPVDETVLKTGEGDLPEYTLSEEYAQVRETADRLEQEYEISILLSNQCAALAKNDFATMTTTDQAGLDNEIAYIEDALADLETAMELYPEGYFGQFRKSAGERGILFLLVKDIATDLNAIGVCYMLQNWYVVAVDITSGEVLSTYCHELWHATENKINSQMPLLLSDKVWSECNPEGYTYTYDTSADYIKDIENTLYGERYDKDVYFIDPYGKTKPQEDRARLMEYVMTVEHYAKRICNINALRKKLEIMADAIRQVFDTTGWETPYWERYF